MNFATLPYLGILGRPDSEELWTEIINKIEIRPNMKFLNVAAGHGTEAKLLARKLVESGYYTRDEAVDSIYLIDKYMQFTNPLKRMGFKNVIQEDFLTWETDMKFDVVLGNPPFSKAGEGKTSGKKSKNLYPAFYKKAIDIARKVAMIMPRTDKQVQKLHNELIVKTANSIMDINDNVFKVATSVWCVFSDKADDTRINDFRKLESMNDINWNKGKMTSLKSEWVSDRGHQIIHAVHKTGPVVLKSNKTKHGSTLSSEGYSVIFGITAGSCFVIKNEGQLIGVNVYWVHFDDKRGAESFRDTLEQKFKEIDHLRGNSGVMTLKTLSQIEF